MNVHMKEQRIAIFFLLCAVTAGCASLKRSPETRFQIAAEDAAWCWFADPRAVYYKGAHEKIYYSYISSQGDVVISSYDLTTRDRQTYVLHEKLQKDDHNVPSLLFLPSGKMLAFYTEHNGRFFLRKTKNAEDISDWEEERVLNFGLKNELITYSNPVMLAEENNRIYLFFRSRNKRLPDNPEYINWKQNYVYSDDFGETWTEAKAYLTSGGNYDKIPYLKIVSDNRSKIHFLFTDGHPKLGFSSVYHMYYENGVFYQTNGKVVGGLTDIPLRPETVNKLNDAAEDSVRSWIWDIALDKKGYPVVAYAKYPTVNNHIYHYARWDGEKWTDRELIHAGGYITKPEKSGKVLEEHYSGGIMLDHHNPSNVVISRRVNGVFEIEYWQLKGGKWNVKSLTRESEFDNLRPYVVDRYPGKKPLVMWMNGVYEHYTRYKTSLLFHEK